MAAGIDILLVDDDADTAAFVSDGCLTMNLRVMAVRDPRRALEELRKHHDRYRAVVSDYRLGAVMTGLQFLERVKELYDGDLQRILYTAEDHPSLQQVAKDAGVQYVYKDPREMMHSLAHLKQRIA